MDIQAQISRHFFRADLYRILALGFEEPTTRNLESIRGIAQDLMGLVCDTGFSDEIESALGDLAKNNVGHTSVLLAEYHRLFGTHVACPPSEGSYQQVERGPIIGDIQAFYKAFQMRVVAHQGPPDSLKMELGFMSFMALKTVYALENALVEEKGIVYDAQKKFLSSHLGRWAPPFVTKLVQSTNHPFYHQLANLLLVWIEEDCQGMAIHPEPLKPHDVTDEAPVACSLGALGQ